MKKNNSLLQLVVLMAAMLCALGASADEAYACYTPSYTTLTFYYDNQRNIRSGTTYDLNTGGIQPGWVTDGTNASVTKVVFNSSFAGARPTSTFSWFYEMQNLQSITGLNYLNTSEVTKMNWMFGYCSSLTSLDLSTFNTSKVTDMGSMFFGSENLKMLDLSGFNTTKVTNMASMFWSCAELLTVLVDSNWSTTAVTNSVNMFYNCTSLLGGKGTTFNYSNPRDKTYAHIDGGTSNPGYFTAAGTEAYTCYTSSNTTLTFYYDNQRSSRTGTTYDMNPDGNVSNPSPVWSTDGTSSYVTKVVFTPSFANARPRSTSSWFYFMRNLQDITGIEYLNTSEVTTMSSMFSWCDNLTSLDLSHFNTSKVISMYGMFQSSSNLQTIYVGDGWRAATVVYSAKMFDGCTSLVGEQGTTYDASHTDKAYAHIDGGPSNPGYLSEWKEPYACYTPSNTTLTFYCDNLRSSRSGTTYDLNTENEVPGWEISGDNASVTKVVFDPSFAYARPTTTYDWFYNMKNLLSITGMSYLNTSEVTAMTDMFDYCTKLTDLDLSHFNTAKVTDMDGMFSYCTSLTSLDLTSFNTSRLTEMRFMFYNCNQLRTIYVGNGWTMANEPDAYCMFLGCTSLVGGLGTTYSASHTDGEYAHIDGGSSYPGYFTDINSLNYTIFEVDGIYYKLDTYDVLVTHNGTGQYGCYSGTVEIPEQVYCEADGRWYPVGGIDERAFYRCPYLQHLILPNSIGIIHDEAFMDAFMDASNSTITCMALTPPLISPSAPDPYYAPEMTLYVPYGTRSAYQAINAWNQFGNIVELNYSFKKNGIYYKITGDGKVSVTYKDGNYNTYSGRIVIPRTVVYGGVTYTVTAIDNVAFFNCPNLTDVVIPETVTAIGNTTFKGCTSLTSITIPNSVTRMGLYAFENCTALNNVVIGSGMTSIGIMAFHGCTALETGTITCLALDPPTINNQNAFDTNHYHNSTLYVPQSACADYQQAQYWRDFYDMRELWTLDEALNEDGGTIHFESTSAYPWKVVTDGGGALHYAESGNAGVPNTTSTLTATVTVPEGGATLSFTFQAWGEGNEDDRIYDCCAFAIDGTTRLEYGEYQNDWESYSVDLPAGTHTLKWSYSKDASVDPEGDYFAIDHVTLTPKAAGLLGDVDGDGNVGIADVTLLIDYVLTGNSAGVNLDVSNVDGDNIIGIADVTAIIDYILTGTW